MELSNVTTPAAGTYGAADAPHRSPTRRGTRGRAVAQDGRARCGASTRTISRPGGGFLPRRPCSTGRIPMTCDRLADDHRAPRMDEQRRQPMPSATMVEARWPLQISSRHHSRRRRSAADHDGAWSTAEGDHARSAGSPARAIRSAAVIGVAAAWIIAASASCSSGRVSL